MRVHTGDVGLLTLALMGCWLGFGAGAAEPVLSSNTVPQRVARAVEAAEALRAARLASATNVVETPAGEASADEEEPGNAATDASTAEPAGPYQAIAIRNAFGLRTPPPAPPPDDKDKAQNVTPSALKLTGITTLLGRKQAMFLEQAPGAKEPRYSGLVGEGESDGKITNLVVLEGGIDENLGTVRVAYGDKELTLNFVQNGIQPQVGPPPVLGVPGGVGGRPGVGGAPGAVPPPVPVAAVTTPQTSGAVQTGGNVGSSGLRSIPPRPIRSSDASIGVQGAAFQGGAYPNTSQALGYTGGGQYQSQVGTPSANQPVLNPEAQLQVMMEQTRQAEQRGIPMPPIPGVDPGSASLHLPTGEQVPVVPGTR